MSNPINQLIPENEFQTVSPTSEGILTIRNIITSNKNGISGITIVPLKSNPVNNNFEFQTEVPSNDGVWTERSLNTDSLSNNNLLNTYQIVPIQTLPIPIFNQGTCFATINENALITSKEDLFLYLCDVLIRFDTNPNYYQKEDYEALIRLLVGALLHLYDTYAHPVSYKITTSPKTLAGVIPIGHLIRNIMVYNNESFPVTMNLGYTIDGQEFLMSEEVASKTWLTIGIEKVISTTHTTSVYFDCLETLTTNGIYVVIDSTFYFST